LSLSLTRVAKLSFLSLAALAALVFVGASSAAPTPRGAALVTRDCLSAHGWDAVLVDTGVTVNAGALRNLPGWPYRPWYSVSFSKRGGRLYPVEVRVKLNQNESRIAAACRSRGTRP
jgi:hypothetical protein